MFQLQDVKTLLEQSPADTLSLYLNVDPTVSENQTAHPAWRIWAKNALRDLEKNLEPQSVSVWTDIRSRAEDFLNDYTPSSKGLALIYGPELEWAYNLPVAVENQAAFGVPLLAPLVGMLDEYEPYLIVMADNAEARFLITSLGQVDFQEAQELTVDTSDWTHKTIQSASNYAGKTVQSNARDDYDQRVELYRERFYEEVGKHAAQLADEYNARHIIIAGAEHAAHSVHHHLPEKVAGTVVGVTALPMRSTVNEILQHVLPMALDYERQQEMKLVEEVIDLAKAGGRGGIGREAVLHMLDEHRVEMLIAPWPMPDDRLAQELPLRILASGGEVEFVHGPAAERLNAEGGLAARLYYAVPTP